MDLRENLIDEVARTAYYEENLRKYYNSFVNHFKTDLPFSKSLYIVALEEACFINGKEDYVIRIDHDKLNDYMVLLPDIKGFQGFLHFIEAGIITITKNDSKDVVISDKKAMMRDFDKLDDMDKRLFNAGEVVDLFIILAVGTINDEELDEYLINMDVKMAKVLIGLLKENQNYPLLFNRIMDRDINYNNIGFRLSSSLQRIKKIK